MKRSTFYLPTFTFKPEHKLHTVATLVHVAVERVVEFALPTEYKHFYAEFKEHRYLQKCNGVIFKQPILVS